MALFYWVMIHCHNLFLSLTFTHWHSSRLGHFRFVCHSPTIILSFSVLFFRTVSTFGRCVCVCKRGTEKGICPMVPILPTVCQCPAAYCQGASQSVRTLEGPAPPTHPQHLIWASVILTFGKALGDNHLGKQKRKKHPLLCMSLDLSLLCSSHFMKLIYLSQ